MTYFHEELPNGTSLRLYADPTSDGDLRFEVTVGALSVRFGLNEDLAFRLGDAMTHWYHADNELEDLRLFVAKVADDDDVAQPLTQRHIDFLGL